MCVGSVCTHPSYNDKNPPSGFFKSPFSNQAVLRFLSEWSSFVQAPPTIVDWQAHLTLDLPWVSWVNWMSCKQSDRHCVDSGAGGDKMSQIKRLKCFVVGCNNEYSSRHLLPTSEPLKTQRINVTFVLKGMFIYRRSEYKGFYESLHITFPNNLLVNQFRGWTLQSARHPTEERGGVSRAH